MILCQMEAVVNSRILLVAGVVAAAGCARTYAELSPAAGATPASGPGEGAVAVAAGVQVSAHAQAWHFDPPDLETKVTPILIEVANNTDRAITLHYKDIALVDNYGSYAAIPPYNISGRLSVPVTVQDPYYTRYIIAPNVYGWPPLYSPSYSGYYGGYYYQSNYYQPYLTVYANVPLPTPEMVQRALPEGEIAPRGTAGGFIYFKSFGRDQRLMTLTVDIVDAASNQMIGTAQIPFVAH
jgi:hypothetical protein